MESEPWRVGPSWRHIARSSTCEHPTTRCRASTHQHAVRRQHRQAGGAARRSFSVMRFIEKARNMQVVMW